MFLLSAVDIILDVGMWSVKKIFYVGKWAIYGTSKTDMEILIEKQNKMIENLHTDLENITKRLSNIEKK